MARPPIVRSMNYELVEGASDGSVKKLVVDRTDFGFDRTTETRLALQNGIYGIEDAGIETIDILRGVVGPF